MYGTHVAVLALDEQSVRLLVLLSVCLNLNIIIIGVRCSMRSYVISPSRAILLSKSIIHYNGDDVFALLDWPSLVECMERMSCWPLTSSAYVCLYCCLCA